MSDFAVSGADDFYRLSKALKHAGRTQLRKELHKGMQRAAKPIVGKTRQAALRKLPKRGGLAAQIAREPQRVQVRTGLDTAGVRVMVGKSRGGARAANQGVIRHPVFGQDVWVEQPVEPGWFDNTVKAEAPEIRRSLERSMGDFVEQIVRDARS